MPPPTRDHETPSVPPSLPPTIFRANFQWDSDFADLPPPPPPPLLSLKPVDALRSDGGRFFIGGGIPIPNATSTLISDGKKESRNRKANESPYRSLRGGSSLCVLLACMMYAIWTPHQEDFKCRGCISLQTRKPGRRGQSQKFLLTSFET